MASRSPGARAETLALLRAYAAARAAHSPESTEAVAIRNAIVERNVGLMFNVWKRHARQRVEHDEVLALATPGLIKAIERFEVERGLAFSTYASWWIRHALLRAADNESDLVRVPTHARSRAQPPRSAAVRVAAQAARAGCLSLDVPMGDDSRDTFGDQTEDPDALAAFQALEADDAQAALRRALAGLTPMEREVVEAQAAGEPWRDLTLRLGQSRDRLQGLYRRALGRMRRAMGS